MFLIYLLLIILIINLLLVIFKILYINLLSEFIYVHTTY